MLHAFGMGGHVCGSGMHLPHLQLPPVQGVPFGLGQLSLHCPVLGLHLYCMHSSVCEGQVAGPPPMHTPFQQIPWMQGFTSHTLPSGATSVWQCLFLQAAVLMPLQLLRQPGEHTVRLQQSLPPAKMPPPA